MRKLSRLEITCLAVIASIIAVMATYAYTRQDPPAAPESGLSCEDAPPQQERHARNGDTEGSENAIDTEQAGNCRGFSEQAKRIPKPVTGGESPATNLTVTPLATTTPPSRETVFGTNELTLALQRVAAMPWSPASEQLLQETISKWAATSPLDALKYALQIESRRVRSFLISGIFSSWAKSDANAAYSWLLANRESDPGTFQTGLRPVLTALAARGIDNAMKMALGIATGPDRLSAMRIVVDQASRGGTAASLVAYLDGLQAPGERQSYASMLGQSWSVYAPQDAAQWAMSLQDPVLRKAAVSSTVGVWASDNPRAAADWVLTLPAGELKSTQIAQVTQSWARYDPVNAADWLLSQHPPSPALDPAVQSLVNTVMKSNPEGAVMWASTINDPKLRASTLVNASREWLRHDPAKASAYIVRAPISPAQRARLLRGH